MIRRVPAPLSIREPENWPELLSATKVASLLGLERHTVLDMIARGELPATKIGRQWRIAPDDVWPFIPASIRARWPPGPWRNDDSS